MKLADEYDDFVRGQSDSFLYHGLAYKNLLKAVTNGEEEYLVAKNSNGIQAVFPLLYSMSGNKRVYNSLPYFGSYGGILSAHHDASRLIADAYREIITSSQVVTATVICSPYCHEDKNKLPHQYKEKRLCQITELTKSHHDEHSFMRVIENSARRNINKARASNILIEKDASQLAWLGVVHQETMSEKGGVPKPHHFFELIPSYFTSGRDYDVYVAKEDGNTIAALLVFYFNSTVEYFVPATRSDYKSHQPQALILATAMTDAARRGFVRWNWGGTWGTQVGVYRFKRKWGAKDWPYFYYTYLNDESVLGWSSQQILAAYPHFYVIPFGELRHDGLEASTEYEKQSREFQ